MPCPTCSETLQCVLSDDLRAVHWCPRCGTLQTTDPRTGRAQEQEAPRLVGACRLYWTHVACASPERSEPWVRAGIADAISLPEYRPQ